ncbi:CapA family protein [Pseudoalteromonas sp. SR45-6]|uniref:CapA family protein n=1 Tax=Pseudoalteromonas sp. SR45-6 TaxID=2760927 RepID=UPI001603D0B6|nr:CapA family protein [Pseudoalteromonas sp. SR45-6]MBB1343943.1 CapA family protein [Pseudoalteromonas sp. SR45-6]
MIFLGDIAIGSKVDLECPDFFRNKKFIANLEGSLVKNVSDYVGSRVVVNDYDAIKLHSESCDVTYSICNNHILDNGNINETIENLHSIDVDFFGAGRNLNEASEPLELDDVIVLNFGWSIVECPEANTHKPGVNPLKDAYVINEFKKYKNRNPNKKIIVFFHWDYELEAYPMPSQRALAHNLIDLGCDCIVGTHSHRVQGAEIYKGKPIIYSLGNWLFQQDFFISGRLAFPRFCDLQLAFEFSLDGEHLCHFFKYNKQDQKVDFYKTENLMNSSIMNELTPFSGFSFKEYDLWFSKNRYHKKLIPVYFSRESRAMVFFKNKYNRLRTFLISVLVKAKVKL